MDQPVEDTCEQCLGEATVFCEDCNNSYCTACSRVRHRVAKRSDHRLSRLSALDNVTHTPLDENSPWNSEGDDEAQLLGYLMKNFQKKAFKDWQLYIIKAALEGKNTLVVQPTGAGKSLCFQFPSLITKKMTIVVTPTISLMIDQVHHLKEYGLQATFLGSAQKNPETERLVAQNHHDLVYCTPESFIASTGNIQPLFQSLIAQGKIGMVAIDEAHLLYSWSTFRPCYGYLQQICSVIPGIPVMALTATAKPATLSKLKLTLEGPVSCVGSINKTNIYYSVNTIVSQGGVDKYTNLATQLAPAIEDSKSIVYVDFIRDVAPLAISLRQHGLETCGYHGDKMTANDKQKALENWKEGTIQVMVCTSAFAMGIDEGDVRKVVRVGCPPSLEQLVQEFGRAGRDGLPCEGVIFYHESDLQHAYFWHKAESSLDRKKAILNDFQDSWRFVHSDVGGICRRAVILEYFGEDTTISTETENSRCCDVCESSTDLEDGQKQLVAVLNAVIEKVEFGEKKIAQTIQQTRGLTIQYWRTRIRQAWLIGLLNRGINLGKGHNLLGNMVYNSFSISADGNAFLNNPTERMLPSIKLVQVPLKHTTDGQASRKGKGCQALPAIRRLMSSADKWFTIVDENDYHYPGVFTTPFPQRMGYCPDITQLPKFDKTNKHFLYTDIQFSKGNPRNPRNVIMNVDGVEEMMNYRLVPCGGVKLCAKHSEGCSYTIANREKTKCPAHPEEKLINSGECRVEFVYVWPENDEDNRRWISGVSRSTDSTDDNLHSHPCPPCTRLPSKVQTDWKNAVCQNPSLKTKDLLLGKGMDYMPAASALAATNRGKMKNLRMSALRSAEDPRACILLSEKETLSYDATMKKKTQAKHLDQYASQGHPYIRGYNISSDFSWVLSMSPLQAELLGTAECAQFDVTYRSSIEFEYLLNAVVFNYTTLRWHVVARVRMNRITTEAYQQAFQAVFSTVKDDQPSFSVGKTLLAIVLDWSDQQLKGLEAVIGEETAAKVVKGCQVHFTRSVKRVSERINKGNPLAHKAFTAIAYTIPKATSRKDVLLLFNVLAGDVKIEKVFSLCKGSSTLKTYAKSHQASLWKACHHWASWWTQPKHLCMLTSCCSEMSEATFSSTPSTTNAVESHNRCSKSDKPDILKVAIMSTYKIDMAASMDHIAASQGIKTSYEDLSPAARASRTLKANKTRLRKRLCSLGVDLDGPPDKKSNFQSGSSSTSNTVSISDEDDDFEDPKIDNYWVESLWLKESNRLELKNGNWLSATHMEAAESLVKKNFAEIGGLQPVYLPNSQLVRQTSSTQVQIHHDPARAHWVTSCFMNGTIKLYDSLRSKTLSAALQEQLKILYGSLVDSEELDIEVPSVQQQRGDNDCGVFAIAFLFHLALGDSPEDLIFTMRHHLETCFSTESVLPFTNTTRTRCKRSMPQVVFTIKL